MFYFKMSLGSLVRLFELGAGICLSESRTFDYRQEQ